MKIASWNVERLKHKKLLDKIKLICEQLQADILVLTETDEQICPDYKYCFQTPKLTEIAPDYYKATESRVSIFTNYRCVRQYDTYDKYTSVCVELETEYGNLIVYGTIIGIYGNRHKSFNEALLKQIEDYSRLVRGGSLCICGDFNCSFCDNYYYTKFARNTLKKVFSDNEIKLVTEDRKECIDHIAVSDKFILNKNIKTDEWNYDKKYSDHKGIVIDF